MNGEYKKTDEYRDGRVKIREFNHGSVYAEIYQKDRQGGGVFFDVKLVREYLSDGERKRGPFIQQRDMYDVIICTVEAQRYISDRHREIRNSQDPEKKLDDGYSGKSSGSEDVFFKD